ncbi:MAG: DUF2220 family protein [Desulfobacterales bacterium]|nr:DUF2220 family protein [Desulfobacterales bacterium]
MISPADIRKKGLRQWPALLRSHLTGEPLLPIVIPVKRITGRSLSDNFTAVRCWLETLRAGEKQPDSPGYRIEYQQIKHRRLGEQSIPVRIIIETRTDFLALTGRERQFSTFRKTVARILAELPELRDLLIRRPDIVLQYKDAWPRLLGVAAWFKKNPRPGCYVRELDIAGVDSKFVEGHRPILAAILDLVLPAAAIDRGVKGLGQHGFERRFGLAWDQPLIRFRLLDPSRTISGLTDLSVPLADFTTLVPPCSRVFITENKTSGLSFPPLAEAMVIFGLGYGIQSLQQVEWLRGKTICYWGDIDTHGFAILSQLRGYFPQVRSLLMDRQTLMAHRSLWGREEEAKRCLLTLEHLGDQEQKLYHDLRDNRIGQAVRLEQERIGFSTVQAALRRVMSMSDRP